MLRLACKIVLPCWLLLSCQTGEGVSPISVVQFEFQDWSGPTLNVYGVEPQSADTDAPVIFVMHGVRRNADTYRDNWIALAEEYGLRVYAPEFDQVRFPGAELYNLGGVGQDGPRAFDAIDPLYKFIVEHRQSDTDGYVIFGHSAGAQFVHRFTCFGDTTHLKYAIAANAGWYTMPDDSFSWPYGLAQAPETSCSLQEWFSKPLFVLLGDQDIDPQDQFLRRTPEAMDQGPHRMARGENFMQAGRALAAESNLSFAWHQTVVAGVGHDNAGMAKAAASIIAERLASSPDTERETD